MDAPQENANVASAPPNPNTQEAQAEDSIIGCRVKEDPRWQHVTFRKEGRTRLYTCLYCSKVYKGGGINRLKQHLAGVRGNIASCSKVPHNVRQEMMEALKKIKEDKQQDDLSDAFGDDEVQQGVDVHTEQSSQMGSHGSCQVAAQRGKKRASDVPHPFFAPKIKATSDSQPSLQSVWASKQAVHKADMAWARWMYEACIPFNVVRSPLLQEALDASFAIGRGYKFPSYDAVRINLLRDCKKECQLLVEAQRAKWAKTGCTIMADGWTDQRQRTLINFLVYCPAGITFVKSVDASAVVKDAQTLCDMFSEVIEWVGRENVVHVVTDNAANYVKAGGMIHEKYKTIFWSPCAAHCLNLFLKDIGTMPHVANLASKASKVTVFIYNHIVFLSWLRKREGWKEIVRPGVTRFATTFITLKSIYEHKSDLQALVIDKYFTGHKLSKTVAGKAVSAIVLDNKFWNDCYFVSKLVAPLVKLLKIVDGDAPSLGYVYEGMQRAKNAIKEMFKGKKDLYKPYTDIIKIRWDKHLKRNLHAVAYFSNPAFVYDKKFCEKSRVTQALIELFEIKALGLHLPSCLKEMHIYRERELTFNRESALTVADKIPPGTHQWWTSYGGSAPNLKKLAIRILSQTSSSSGCERNWSFFERIHTKKRNRLEHQRLSDLVYVTYNLRLKNRYQRRVRKYDPIDFESIDEVDFWVLEEEAPPDFDASEADNELETLIYEVNALPKNGGSSRSNEGDAGFSEEPILDSDLDRFQLGSHQSLSVDDDSLGSEEGFNFDDYYD